MSTSKRFKRDYTSLEQLPNELFVEIFGYLNGVDAVYAFTELNNRFRHLLINYVNVFDFKSISKIKFDYANTHHDVHYWRSLRLCEDDQTPGQIKLFSQLYSSLETISQLEALSLLNVEPKFARNLLSELLSFDRLVSLTLSDLCGDNIQPFQLPSLRRLVITACKQTSWIMNFHHLEKLDYTIKHTCNHEHILTLPTTLKQLTLFYTEENDGNALRTSLRGLAQLTKLTLHNQGIRSPLPNGRDWEELIQSSLPLLKTFQFCFPFHSYHNTSDDIKNVVASFSTPFYLLEKRWFIRCDYDSRYSVEGTLYTLPFAFTTMPINISSFDTSMSTLILDDINEAKYNSYGQVKTLLFNEKCHMPDRGFLSSYIIRLVLQTALPTSWHFLLTNLRHVEFRRTLHMPPMDFAHFLANAPQLQSLTLPISMLSKLTDKFTNTTVCDLLSERIQSLTISRFYSSESDLGDVSVRLLIALVRVFNKSCKHLSLALTAHPTTVLPILRRMRHLHSLHIRYHPWSRVSSGTVTSWIEQPPTIIHSSDFMYVANDYHFYVWFGNRQ